MKAWLQPTTAPLCLSLPLPTGFAPYGPAMSQQHPSVPASPTLTKTHWLQPWPHFIFNTTSVCQAGWMPKKCDVFHSVTQEGGRHDATCWNAANPSGHGPPAHGARRRGPGDTDWASSSPPTLRLTLASHWLFARVLSCSGHNGFFHRRLEQQQQDNQFKLLFILLCQALDPFFNSTSWKQAQAPRTAQISCVKVPSYQNTGDSSSPSQRLPLLYQNLIKASFHELFCWANKFNLIFYTGSS